MKTVSLLKDNFFTDGKYYYEGEWHYDGFGNRYPFLNTFKAKKLDKTQIEKIMVTMLLKEQTWRESDKRK